MKDELLSQSLLVDGPKSPRLILAHGAGAPMDSDFMAQMTTLLTDRGVGVVRFEFPYMAQRRHGGSKRPPNRQAELLEYWAKVIQCVGDSTQLFIGGKSMGGRMATMLADEQGVKGLVCLGYPFHPQGKPEKTRIEHLRNLATPALFVQGSRDALGSRDEVRDYELPKSITMNWLEDGNHDLKPRVKSGYNHEQHLMSAADSIAAFILQHSG